MTINVKKIKMNEIQFISHLKGLNLDQNIPKLEKKIKNDITELINVTNQIKIENFLSGDLSDLLTVNYIDIINSIKRKPTRIYSNFTGMNSGIILEWIMSILQNPEAYARFVVKYFRTNNKNLNYFSAITFPCLFHHFFTEDFQKLSYRFLLSMLETGDIGTFWYFCLSFIESSSNFSTVLWTNFLNLNQNQSIFFTKSHISPGDSNQNQLAYQPKIQRSQIFFLFLKCLKTASTALSVYQQQIVKKFFEANAPTCAFFLCKYFIERSFFWFRGNEPDQKGQISSEMHSGSSKSSSDRSANNPFLSENSLSYSSKNESNSSYDESISYKNDLYSGKNAAFARSLNEEIIKILEYAALNPKSPQFTKIVNVLTTSNYSRFVPNIVGSHTNFILSPRDCYLIQEIIRQNLHDLEEESKKNGNEGKDSSSIINNINFVKVFPLTTDSFNNFAPMSMEIPLVSFFEVYKDKKLNNFNSFDSNSKDLSLFDIKNDKLQKLLDLAMFNRFIENELSKRKFEQSRSHFCFASKLLQKNQFVKRKMIDFNSFYGYFQTNRIKRHTHSDQTAFNENKGNKAKKGITSHKSYYGNNASNLFDLPILSIPPLSPEPKTSRCPLSNTVNTSYKHESSDSAHSFQEKKINRKVVFNTNYDDDFQDTPFSLQYASSTHRRRQTYFHSQTNLKITSDFGYNNEEYVMKTEVKNKKRSSFYNEKSFQTNSYNNHSDPNNTISNNNNQNDNDGNQASEKEKPKKKDLKKEKKKLKKEKRKEKKQAKKEKNEERKNKEKIKDDEKEEKREEKILMKEVEHKEKKEKKEFSKLKKEEEKLKKIRKKKEKRREKMRKDQEKKIKKNSEISLSDSFNNDDNNDDDSLEVSNNNQIESRMRSKSDNNDIDENSNIFPNQGDSSDHESSQESQRHYNSSIGENENSSEDENIDDKKVSENIKLKKSKKKKREYTDENIDSYVSSSILLTTCDRQKNVTPILNNLIPQIENNESQLILYCIKINDFEFKSRRVNKITTQYVQLINSLRIRKIRKYTICHSNWISAANLLANEIDFMSDFNIGTAIIIFCQICKFFSPLSTYGQTSTGSIPAIFPSSSNGSAENNISGNRKLLRSKSLEKFRKNKKNIKLDKSIHQSISHYENLPNLSIKEEESDFKIENEKINNEENKKRNNSDTDSIFDIYSYSGYKDHEDSENTYSDINDSTLSNSFNMIKDYKDDTNNSQIFIFPPSLINKDVVKFLKFVLMLSHTDCFIQYFTWISKVLVVFPQIKNLLGQIYGIDVSHLEMAFKILLSKIDLSLLIKIREEVFKEARKPGK